MEKKFELKAYAMPRLTAVTDNGEVSRPAKNPFLVDAVGPEAAGTGVLSSGSAVSIDVELVKRVIEALKLL